MPWVPRPNAGPDEFDWVDEDPYPTSPAAAAPSSPYPEPNPNWQQAAQNEAANPFPTTNTNTRHPNAGPDGSTQPNMDPPGITGGYWMNGQWVSGSPRGTGESVYSGGDLFGGAPPSPTYPEWSVPGRTPVGEFKPRTSVFELDPYKASSWEDAEKEPGYAASREQLRKQIEAGAAHRGMLRSGMTIGNLYSNLDALSQQNFKQFDDRNFRNWGANQSQRLDKFDREYGIDRDVYDRYANEINTANDYGYRAAVDRNNYQFNVADASARDALDRWKTRVAALASMARPVE